METLLLLAHDILRLKRLRRSGYLFYGLPDAEHIADHVFSVAWWAMVLADRLRMEGYGVDVEKVVRMALIHEIGEARLGDLHYEARELLGEGVVQRAEEGALRRVLHPLDPGLRDRYTALWKEFEEGKSLEARVVRLADRLDLLLQSLQYESQGHRTLEAIWTHPRTRSVFAEVPGGEALLERMLQVRNEVHPSTRESDHGKEASGGH